MLRTEASRPRLVGWSVGLQNKISYEPALSSKQDLLSMRGVAISPQHKETNIQNNICYEIVFVWMDISPQHKETNEQKQ